jgi:hypothetical protein
MATEAAPPLASPASPAPITSGETPAATNGGARGAGISPLDGAVLPNGSLAIAAGTGRPLQPTFSYACMGNRGRLASFGAPGAMLVFVYPRHHRVNMFLGATLGGCCTNNWFTSACYQAAVACAAKWPGC